MGWVRVVTSGLHPVIVRGGMALTWSTCSHPRENASEEHPGHHLWENWAWST